MGKEARERQVALARRKIVAIAFGHLQVVNARTSLFLTQFGMTDRPTASSQDQLVREAVANPNHPARVKTGQGPLLVIDTGEKSTIVLDLRQMLLHDELKVRKAAVRHFHDLSTQANLLTPKSKSILNRLSPQITKSKAASWHNTSVEMYDTLRQDFFCSLAAFKQCLQLDYRAGITEQAKAMFWPSLNSVDSIDDPLCTISRLRDDAKKELQGKLKGAETLENALTRYFTVSGHLALLGEMSAAGLVNNWMKEHTENDVWATVWQWAERLKSPLARYHACQIFAQHPDLVPKDGWERYFNEVGEILLISYIKERKVRQGEAWRIRCSLAKHYCQHLESLRPPEGSAETLAAFSWWLAEQVATVCGNNERYLAAIRKETVDNLTEQSELVWQLAHPWAEPSKLRYCTLRLKSLWSVALAAQLQPALEHFKGFEMPANLVNSITEGLTGCVIAYLPLLSSAEEPVFAFELPLIDVAKQWLANDIVFRAAEQIAAKEQPPAEGGREEGKPPTKEGPNAAEELLLFASLSEHLCAKENHEELCTRLASSSDLDAVIISGALRAAAYCGTLDPETLWKQMSSEEWRGKVLGRVRENGLDALVDGLVELQYRVDPDKRCELPHFICDVIEKGVEDAHRLEMLFTLLLLTSICTDTSSGLQRLLSRRKALVEEHAKSWHEKLIAVSKGAPPWIAARVRPILVVLPPFA